MNPIRQRRKIRALELLHKIEAFSLREKLLELHKLDIQQAEDKKLLDSTATALAEYDEYESQSSIKSALDDRSQFLSHYRDALLFRQEQQQAMVSANDQARAAHSKESEQSYNREKNLGKKLKQEYNQYHQAVELYNAEV